jgi:hypothetical protein
MNLPENKREVFLCEQLVTVSELKNNQGPFEEFAVKVQVIQEEPD